MKGKRRGVDLQLLRLLLLAVCWLMVPALRSTAAVSVAVFPFQELKDGRNDVNLSFTMLLAERLAMESTEIIDLKTVIAFMANNRIRHAGFLESANIIRARRDLGAAFVLLATISQQKEKLEPSIGLVLNLVRTSDGRSIWTYVDSVGVGEERNILGIDEPQSVADLQPLLLDRLVAQWPWKSIAEEAQPTPVVIDSTTLEPRYVSPGEEVHGLVRLGGDVQSGGQAPRVFFKVDDQLYPAIVSEDGRVYESTWVAGEDDGNVAVTLLFEWPDYGRSETDLLGNYFIDGTPPLLEIGFRGTLPGKDEDIPMFRYQLVILPRLLLREPISHWRLAFKYETGNRAGSMEGKGNLPKSFYWNGLGTYGKLEDGFYEVIVQVWDRAGNFAEDSRMVQMDGSLPKMDMSVERSEEGAYVDLENKGKVPLSFWRLEMWTKEGKLLTQMEGKELPVKIGVDLPEVVQDEDIQGYLYYRDILGKQYRKKVQELFPKIVEKAASKVKKSTTVSEGWVNDF